MQAKNTWSVTHKNFNSIFALTFSLRLIHQQKITNNRFFLIFNSEKIYLYNLIKNIKKLYVIFYVKLQIYIEWWNVWYGLDVIETRGELRERERERERERKRESFSKIFQKIFYDISLLCITFVKSCLCFFCICLYPSRKYKI